LLIYLGENVCPFRNSFWYIKLWFWPGHTYKIQVLTADSIKKFSHIVILWSLGGEREREKKEEKERMQVRHHYGSLHLTKEVF
jgi:hypothetical protein